MCYQDSISWQPLHLFQYSHGVLPTDAKILKIIVHPKYSPPKKYYDIALMELEKNVRFTKFIQPACLWNKFDTSALGTEATLTGWGVVETSKFISTLILFFS